MVAVFCASRSRVTVAFLQPLGVLGCCWASGFNASFLTVPASPAGVSYAEYFYPGVIALVLLFTAIFATISTIPEDPVRAFHKGVLVAPITRQRQS